MTGMLRTLFGVEKPVIGMAHFLPLPGTTNYDSRGGIEGIVASLTRDVAALQEGPVDAILFGNEGDRPYRTRVSFETVAVMSRVITELRPTLRVPFGVDVLWDPMATVALAKATGAAFAREVFTSAYASDLGLWLTDCGEVFRYRKLIDAEHVPLFFNVNAEFGAPLAPRPLGLVARSVALSSLPDALCVSGPITGDPAQVDHLTEVKEAVPDVPVLANTGVSLQNVDAILRIADGAIVGTSLKRDGITWNPVDPDRVRAFMARVRSLRQSAAR